MKKYLLVAVTLMVILVSVSWVMMPPKNSSEISTGSGTELSIPDDLMVVFKNSCMTCHSSEGKGMAKSIIDFSKWDSYKPEKQTKKAEAICNVVTKGSMPPKGYIESNPGAALSQEQKDMICKWGKPADK